MYSSGTIFILFLASVPLFAAEKSVCPESARLAHEYVHDCRVLDIHNITVIWNPFRHDEQLEISSPDTVTRRISPKALHDCITGKRSDILKRRNDEELTKMVTTITESQLKHSFLLELEIMHKEKSIAQKYLHLFNFVLKGIAHCFYHQLPAADHFLLEHQKICQLLHWFKGYTNWTIYHVPQESAYPEWEEVSVKKDFITITPEENQTHYTIHFIPEFYHTQTHLSFLNMTASTSVYTDYHQKILCQATLEKELAQALHEFDQPAEQHIPTITVYADDFEDSLKESLFGTL